MTTYSDLTATTDYDSFDTYGSYEESAEMYEEPAASSCCCSGDVEPASDWPDHDPAPSVYDVPEDGGSIWTDPPPAASAIIPAGQPGGPAPVAAVDGDWNTQSAHEGLYTTVAPIADQAPATHATNGFEQGFEALGSPADSFGTSSGFGTGFSALASTSDSSFSPSDFGTGFSALHTASASPLATTMTINSEINPLGHLYANAAGRGDVMTQILLGRVQVGQNSIGGAWL
ncbi:MAG: hypothetical protein ABIP36_01200 [Acidimicrobiales bacterium]